MSIKIFSLSVALVLVGCVEAPLSTSVTPIIVKSTSYVVSSPSGNITIHIPKAPKPFTPYEEIRHDEYSGNVLVINHVRGNILEVAFWSGTELVSLRHERIDLQKSLLARALADAPDYASKPEYQIRTFQHNGWHIISSCRPDANFTCVMDAYRLVSSTVVMVCMTINAIISINAPADADLQQGGFMIAPQTRSFEDISQPASSAKTATDVAMLEDNKNLRKIHLDPNKVLSNLLLRLDSIQVE